MLVKTITLDIAGHTRVQLRRTSGASFLRGDFRLFCEIALGRLTRSAGERRELMLTGNGSRRLPSARPSPSR